MSSSSVVVVGLGEVGMPLLELVSRAGEPVMGIDVAPAELPASGSVDVMHLCFPFQVDDFVAEAVRYVDLLEPRLTIVNSTVAVGTTRAIHERTGAQLAYSPVRGKHARMLEELSSYVKFVGGIDAQAGQEAAEHFSSLGLRTRLMSSPEAAELAKLTETTYFGLLIAWAQEVERYCDVVGADYEEIVSFYEEIGFLPPVRYSPGVIGGHCVMPNIEILERLAVSGMLDAIKCSNALKTEREGSRSEPLEAARRR
jgi:UDP-N-acetyl-D-mannosaminuronate dehydrogenase